MRVSGQDVDTDKIRIDKLKKLEDDLQNLMSESIKKKMKNAKGDGF